MKTGVFEMLFKLVPFDQCVFGSLSVKVCRVAPSQNFSSDVLVYTPYLSVVIYRRLFSAAKVRDVLFGGGLILP